MVTQSGLRGAKMKSATRRANPVEVIGDKPVAAQTEPATPERKGAVRVQ
jgi:hypothetical protein